MSIKSSVYFHLFNIEKMGYNAHEIIENFHAFFNEVVVATIKGPDVELLESLKSEFPNLKVVATDISLDDNRFDGKLKTAALKECANPIRVIADGDERFVFGQKELWQKYYELLLADPKMDGLMVPVLDLWGGEDKIRIDVQIGQKFRIHKDTIVERGVIPAAERADGLFETSISDSTEPLTADRALGNFANLVPPQHLMPLFCRGLAEFPYVLHYGYLDLAHRANVIAPFWKEKWEQRSGREENVELNLDKLTNNPTIEHGLQIK